ncbi:putative mitotic spindle checkpoint protein Mad2 [Helianthus debilis subsp. tardiflorus]
MLCSILHNRGVYPEESFVKKYGLPLLLSQDEGVKTFIANLNTQLSEWLEAGKLQRIVLVIMSKATNEVLEKWNFSIETDKKVVEKEVSREKSIFDVLAYTDMDVAVPFTWTECDQKLIANPQMVKLHSFDTKIHKVETLVSYKNDERDEQ